jgi:hypothetical protein
MDAQTGIEGQSVIMDMSEWMSRVALESVGQTVLGYSFDPLDSPHNNPYTAAIKELVYVCVIFRILDILSYFSQTYHFFPRNRARVRSVSC